MGLLRVATRMLSREKYAADILGLLGTLFISAEASAAMSLIHKAPRSSSDCLSAENELVHAFSSQVFIIIITPRRIFILMCVSDCRWHVAVAYFER